MDLIDEQHIARLQVRQHRGEIARTLEHRPGGLLHLDAELRRDDVRERRLAESRRPEDQHVIERFATLARSADENLELRLHGSLADVIGERARTNGAIYRLVFASSTTR